METWLGLVAVLALVATTAFFVAVEFSLVAVDRTEVELAAAAGNRRSVMIAAVLRRLSFHLSGVQLGISVCSVVLGLLAEPTVARALRGPLESYLSRRGAEATSVVVALFLATVVQMLLGELIPKAIAIGRPRGTAEALVPILRWYAVASRPIVVVFTRAADRVVRAVGVEPLEELSQVRSRAELAHLVRSSGEEGTLEADEVDLLTRAFRFQDKTVAEALTPRTEIVALSRDSTGADLVAASDRTGFSRFPVHGEGPDDIVGIVHVKSVLDVDADRRATVAVSDLMVEPLAVPEARALGDLMAEMRRRAVYLAIVLDEYGGTAGLISLEDLLEEIVGEIEDEHDRAGARSPVWRWGAMYVLAGRLHLDEVVEACGLTLPRGEYETLAGFVLDRLGHIPVAGESFEHDGWVVDVMEMDRRRVSSVRLVAPEGTVAMGGGSP